jgi:epsilon-lactone hydrolase
MSIQLFFADKLIRLTMKRRMAKDPDVMTLRKVMAEMPPAKVPSHVQIDQISLAGVPTERLSTATTAGERAILYIHGGGFVGGSPLTHRSLTWRMAEKTNASIYAIDYRLAPEHPFPAGLDDCVNAYRALLEAGFSPADMSIGGDSAGGNLALAACLKMKTLQLPLPASMFCLSPVTDMDGEPESRRTNSRRDAMFDAGGFHTVVGRYCPGHDPKDPLISPLRGDVSGLPPTLLHCSRDEMLRDDSVLMAAKLKAAGVPVELEVWPKVFHVWHIAADTIPESRQAVDKVVQFVNACWGSEKRIAA